MAAGTWYPPSTQHLVIQGNMVAGNLMKAGPNLGEVVDSGIVAGFTGATTTTATVTFPPIGNPHVANAVYITDAGVWMVSTG